MKEVIRLFKQIQETSSLNEKKSIITANKDNELFKKCLRFLLDGNITTGISDKKWDKFSISSSTWIHEKNIGDEFAKLLHYISMNNTGRDEDILLCKSWCYSLSDEIREFTKQIITKKYRLGADAKLVNKCIPNLIPTFNIQLGTSIEKVKLSGNEKIFISRKLNGTRCAFIGDKCLSRQNKEYKGLEHIIADLQKLVGTETFVDGELLYKNKEQLTDSEAFQFGTGLAMSKDKDKSELKLVVFDMFPLEEFWNGVSKEPYSNRKKQLLELKNRIEELGTDNIEIVQMCYEGYDHSEIWKWLDYAEKHDWEGIMINLDTLYECKRTKNLIKVKHFFEKDLRCVKVNIATTGKYKGIMGSITCNYFDNTVDIGSGFNDKQRKYYAEYPEDIVGKIISCKYKEETQNKDGGKSLQFPVYMGTLIDRDKAIDEN